MFMFNIVMLKILEWFIKNVYYTKKGSFYQEDWEKKIRKDCRITEK